MYFDFKQYDFPKILFLREKFYSPLCLKMSVFESHRLQFYFPCSAIAYECV